jgi:hypothetical protein
MDRSIPDKICRMRRVAAILITLSMPAFCAAQAITDARLTSTYPQVLSIDSLLHPTNYSGSELGNLRSNLQATPLWGTPDGRVLAIVAMADNSIPSKPQSPQIGSGADWKFVDVTNFVTSGVLLNLSRDAAARATISRGAVLAPTYALNDVSCGQLLSPGLTSGSCGDRAVVARTGMLQLGTDWTILQNLDLDLSYGLGWLRHETATPAGATAPPLDIFAAVGNPQFPTLLIPGLESANIQSTGLSALGHWHLDGPASLDFGASLNRYQLSAPNAPLLTSLNQAAVSFGLHHGAFSGMVTGHVLGPADSFNGSARWAGLDIGFSWRTPWQGEFTFGTQNLWSSGSLPNLADPSSHEVESNQARVPYVQYHQDL